jgi:hypothetical protein
MKILKFSNFIESKSINESSIFTDFDKKWDYKKDGEKWFAKKKDKKDWIDISDKPDAVNKLNTKYFSGEKSAVKTDKKENGKLTKGKSSKIALKFDDPASAIKSDSFDPYKKDLELKKEIASKVVIEKTKKVAEESLKRDVPKTSTGIQSKIPLHLRAYLNFLSLRKTPFTKSDLTKSEMESILTMIEMRKAQKKFSSGQNFDFYNASNDLIKKKGGSEQIKFSAKDLGFNQVKVSEDSTKIALALGNAKVTETPNSYVIDDIYDFNNYQKHPEDYTLKSLPATTAKALGEILTSNYIQGLERLSAIFHKFGYKGFPVKIEVPKKIS